MTRKELKEAISAAGVEFKSGLTKSELEALYAKVHVHRTGAPTIKLPRQPRTAPVVEPIPGAEPVEPVEPAEPVEPVEPVEPAEPAEPANEFDELLGKIGGASAPEAKVKKDKPLIEGTRHKKKKGESSPDSFRIEGYVLLLITDTVFPFTFAFLNNMLDKKMKVTASDLQLSEKDFAKLEPLADQAADYMSISLNPIAGFLLISTFMYGNNLIAVRMQLTAENK